jgi:hypothetical protein
MDKSKTIISEYEELVKIKEFHMNKKWDPLHWTYQKVIKDLEREYVCNISEKVDRWITITNARYFKYSTGVLYYFQAKMLFRDGYYEAAIAVSRSICEMICYDFLSKESHPFGTEQDIEQTMFGPLLKFLAIPKHIGRKEFISKIVDKLETLSERNYIKSCYKLEKDQYSFKIEIGKDAKNLKRIHAILDETGYSEKGIFKANTYEVLQSVYNLGSDYIHARKSNNGPKVDAITCLNDIGRVLAYLYTVEDLIGKEITTGYNEFPDVCKGVSFWMDAYFSPEAADRGYVNAPSEAQFDKMVELEGDWHGEWKDNSDSNEAGMLRFIREGEYLKASMEITSREKVYDNITIRLFGNYFHLIIHDRLPEGSPITIMRFELEIFNNTTLLGQIIGEEKKAFFTKFKQPVNA